jgi:hypothetical protein
MQKSPPTTLVVDGPDPRYLTGNGPACHEAVITHHQSSLGVKIFRLFFSLLIVGSHHLPSDLTISWWFWDEMHSPDRRDLIVGVAQADGGAVVVAGVWSALK